MNPEYQIASTDLYNIYYNSFTDRYTVRPIEECKFVSLEDAIAHAKKLEDA